MNSHETSYGVFDALFGQAVFDNFYDELDSLQSDKELSEKYTFSRAHEMKMKKLFAKEARRETLHEAATWSRRIAAAFIIVVTLLFATLMSVPQVRAVVFQTLTEWYEKFVRFSSSAPESEKTSLEPEYIPEGFVEIAREEMSMMVTIMYMDFNEDMVITFHSAMATHTVSVDNEEKDYTILEMLGIEYHLFTSQDGIGDNSIVWDVNGQRYSITSSLSVELLIKMATSVNY